MKRNLLIVLSAILLTVIVPILVATLTYNSLVITTDSST
jgi:hypothetical protein